MYEGQLDLVFVTMGMLVVGAGLIIVGIVAFDVFVLLCVAILVATVITLFFPGLG